MKTVRLTYGATVVEFEGLKLNTIKKKPIKENSEDRSVDGDLISYEGWSKKGYDIRLQNLSDADIIALEAIYAAMKSGTNYLFEIIYNAVVTESFTCQITKEIEPDFENDEHLHDLTLRIEEV